MRNAAVTEGDKVEAQKVFGHTVSGIDLGLRAFLTEDGFGAFTDTFEDLHGMGQLPGIATHRLMASGFGVGDWNTTALVAI